ncbi:universal stress protein [Streptomyces sp. XY431]|uniref:universal stress protein n=1 Tax=Streptomyces sp. XY431 TaxID=1415562 RepID=UPI00336BF276
MHHRPRPGARLHDAGQNRRGTAHLLLSTPLEGGSHKHLRPPGRLGRVALGRAQPERATPGTRVPERCELPESGGATVDAVIAWQYPVGYGVPSPTLQSVDFEENARQALSRVVGEVSAQAPEVTIRRHVVQSHPAAALLHAADGAQLLVVGHRGHGGFAGAHLGSVSQHCVHHAPCPVVVVRGEPGSGPDA